MLDAFHIQIVQDIEVEFLIPGHATARCHEVLGLIPLLGTVLHDEIVMLRLQRNKVGLGGELRIAEQAVNIHADRLALDLNEVHFQRGEFTRRFGCGFRA